MVTSNPRVILSKRAISSIKAIYSYLEAEASEQTAIKIKESIISKCESLGTFSGYSKEHNLEGFPEDYRSVSVWDYVIIYLVTEKEILVLNIIHGKMHPERR